ncbi:hypothetical protein MRX96_031639 [Rhipicephalus microplus]
MLRTFSAKREWISKEIPSIKGITDRYPALMLATIARNEFQTQTGVSLLEKLQDVLTAASRKIIEVARKKRHLKHFFCTFDEAASVAQPPHEDLELAASIRVLPSLVKERMEAFISPYCPDTSYSVPMVTFEGTSLLELTSLKVQVENVSIAEDNLLYALATTIALYWAFDIPTPIVRVAQTLLQ